MRALNINLPDSLVAKMGELSQKDGEIFLKQEKSNTISKKLMKYNLFKILFTISLLLAVFPFQLYSEDFRVIYSSSLTGNLYSCVCGLKLSVGLTKRATFFKQKGIHPIKDILVDTGNSLDVKSSTNKAEAIYTSFQKIGYHSIGIGANDLQEDTISILAANRYPVQSANVFVKGFFGKTFLGKSVIYSKKGNKRIGIISLTSPTIVYNVSSDVKSKLVVNDLESTLQTILSNEKKTVDTWIILLHGTSDEAWKLTALHSNLIVIFGGITAQPTLSKTGYLEVEKKRIYSTGDLLGDKIGILNLSESESGFLVKSSEVISMEVNTLSDSEEILQIMKKFNIKSE